MWWRRLFGDRDKSREASTLSGLGRARRLREQRLRLEQLEERTLLSIGGLPSDDAPAFRLVR